MIKKLKTSEIKNCLKPSFLEIKRKNWNKEIIERWETLITTNTMEIKNCKNILKKIKSMCSHKTLCTNVYRSITHNHQKVKITQMSINWRMDKQNVAFPHNGILLGNKKEWSTGMCYNTDESWSIMLSERSQIQKAVHYMIHLY